MEEPPAEGEKGGRSEGERRGEGTGRETEREIKLILTRIRFFHYYNYCYKYTVVFRAQGIAQRNILCQTLSSKMLSTVLYSLHDKLVQVNYSQVQKFVTLCKTKFLTIKNSQN